MPFIILLKLINNISLYFLKIPYLVLNYDSILNKRAKTLIMKNNNNGITPYV